MRELLSLLRAKSRRVIPQSLLSTASSFKDTIYSLSSGKGKCGVAVIRVSGPKTQEIMMKMGGFSQPPKPRQAILRTVIDAKSKEKLDSGLMLWFPSPNSFTGEDCLELQVHGGVAVVTAILTSLSTFTAARQAEPGEFTKRSLLNGKLDITQVEGLVDVIHSETEAQRKQAYRQMSGELSSLYSTWKDIIVRNCAFVEAYIDFSEEENIEDDIITSVKSSLVDLIAQLQQHLADGRRGERLRDGVHVAILGRPNVGKSSLINYLCRRPVAIVSDQEGTTRDLIESTLDIEGYPVVVVDTAGLRVTHDSVEEEGVRRAVSRSQLADLLIIMLDINELDFTGDLETDIQVKVTQLLTEHFKVDDDLADKSLLVVVNKTDKIAWESIHAQRNHDRAAGHHPHSYSIGAKAFKSFNPQHCSHHRGQLPIECKVTAITGESGTIPNSLTLNEQTIPIVFTSLTQNSGLTEFISELAQLLKGLCANPSSETLSVTQARHRDHLTNCLENLGLAIDTLEDDVVLTAENLRLACLEIGRITGKVSTEDVLDVIFKDFCIGK